MTMGTSMNMAKALIISVTSKSKPSPIARLMMGKASNTKKGNTTIEANIRIGNPTFLSISFYSQLIIRFRICKNGAIERSTMPNFLMS
jgi:hypothetical protein